VLLTSARFVGRNENKQLLALLAALTDAVVQLRETQDRSAQAAAARRAAEHLRLTSVQKVSAQSGAPTATATPARPTGLSFDRDRDRDRPRPGPATDRPRRGPRR